MNELYYSVNKNTAELNLLLLLGTLVQVCSLRSGSKRNRRAWTEAGMKEPIGGIKGMSSGYVAFVPAPVRAHRFLSEPDLRLASVQVFILYIIMVGTCSKEFVIAGNTIIIINKINKT